MNDFKPGDLVVCVAAGKVYDRSVLLSDRTEEGLRNGESYIIASVGKTEIRVRGINRSYWQGRFRKIEI